VREEIVEILLHPLDPRLLEAQRSDYPHKVCTAEGYTVQLMKPALNYCKKGDCPVLATGTFSKIYLLNTYSQGV
jgi:hypothetical protein